MPRNGSGSYSLPAGNPVVPSTVISSTWANTTLSDLGTAITQSIANDGQTTPVANLPMATFRHTNVGNAVARNDYAAAGQVQDSVFHWLTSVAGTNTITASITPSPTAYTAGQMFRFVSAGASTGAVTLNINGLGAKNVTKNGTFPLSSGDIASGSIVSVVYDGTQFQLLSGNGAVTLGAYRVVGLTGLNNAGAPDSKMDFAADEAVLRNPTDGSIATRINTGTVTNDTSLSGPAANGRDQGAAFGSSTWIHFYFIWNGSTLATISSLTAPTTGPALPTGYTNWAYIGPVFKNSGGNLVRTRFRNSAANYEIAQNFLAGGSATVETAVSTALFVPPNALMVRVAYRNTGASADAGGVIVVDLKIRYVSTADYLVIRTDNNTLAVGARNYSRSGTFDIPNQGQNIYYIHSVANGSGQSATLDVLGYTIANGA